MANEQHQESWSPTRIGLLRALWDEGLSTSAIGQRLQITKNAVIGKAHRLQLPPRSSPIRPSQTDGLATKPAPRSRAPQPVPVRQVPVIPMEPITRATVPERAPSLDPEPQPGLTTAALDDVHPGPMPRSGHRRSCAWPLGDPGTAGFRFCGEDAVPMRPYCEQHCCRAYVRFTAQDAATA